MLAAATVKGCESGKAHVSHGGAEGAGAGGSVGKGNFHHGERATWCDGGRCRVIRPRQICLARGGDIDQDREER